MRIILILTLLISIQSFGQIPMGYQKRIVNERIQGEFMVDSAFHLPRYYDTTAANLDKAFDSCGKMFFSYAKDSVYYRACNPKRWITVGSRISQNFANTDLTFTGDRTHNANFEDVEINNLKSWATIAGTSPRSTTFEKDSTYLKIYYRKDGQISELMLRDSILFKPASGVMNIDSLRSVSDTVKNKPITWNVDNGMVSYNTSWAGGGGSGTINSGTTGKPAYYVGATTLDDFAAVDYATSGTNVLITTLNTTDVGLEIKGVSSQSANLQNWSSSAGTGDLASMTKDGYFKSIRGAFGGNTSSNALHVYGDFQSALQITATGGTLGAGVGMDGTAAGGRNWILLSAGSGASSGAGSWAIYDLTGAGFRMFQKLTGEFVVGQDFFDASAMLNVKSYSTSIDVARFHGFEDDDAVIGLWADEGDNDADKWYIKSNKTDNSYNLLNHTTEYFRINSTGGVVMPEIAAPSTPASATAVIYPKSDGLWYGKDDAGVESRLSNLGKSKGAFLESTTSADTLDVWQTPVAITITSLKAILRGSSPSVTYNIGFGTNIQSPTAVFTSDITCTSITTGCSNSSGFNDATIPAGSFIWIYTNAASGTIRSISFTINYTED